MVFFAIGFLVLVNRLNLECVISSSGSLHTIIICNGDAVSMKCSTEEHALNAV